MSNSYAPIRNREGIISYYSNVVRNRNDEVFNTSAVLDRAGNFYFVFNTFFGNISKPDFGSVDPAYIEKLKATNRYFVVEKIETIFKTNIDTPKRFFKI